MLARSLASHKECNNLNSNQLQELIHQRGQNWNDWGTSNKRGRCAVKKIKTIENTIRSYWEIDNEIPIFSQDKNYIEQHLKNI